MTATPLSWKGGSEKKSRREVPILKINVYRKDKPTKIEEN
jgi:hypothetical protein